MIKRIVIEGFKGAGRREYDLSPRTLVVGPNGAGKTTIRQAIDFALGRTVDGVGVKGPGLRSMLAGSLMAVELHLQIPGEPTRVVRRARVLDGETFRHPTLTIDGADADDPQLARLLGANVAVPAGDAWLDLSADALAVELAKLGAEGGREIVSDLLAAARKAKIKPAEYRSTAAQLGAIHQAVAGEVNAAQAARRAIEASTERSRLAQAPDDVAPDHLAAAQAAATTAAEQLAQAKAAQAEAQRASAGLIENAGQWKAGQSQRTERLAKAQQKLRECTDSVQAIEQRLTTIPVPSSDLEKLREGLLAKTDYAAELEREARRAAEVAGEASRGRFEAGTRLSALRERSAHLRAGVCDTCRQSIPPGLVASLDDEIAEAQARFDAAAAAHKAAQDDLAAVDEERLIADEQVRRDRAALQWAEQSATERARAEAALAQVQAQQAAAQANLDAAQAQLTEHQGTKPPDAAEAQAQLAEAQAAVETAQKASTAAQGKLRELAAAAERYARWRSDLADRDRADARVQAAQALAGQVKLAEQRIAACGADVLTTAAGAFVPPALGAPAVFWDSDKRPVGLGLVGPGTTWSGRSYGPALSAAQRAALASAIDRALDSIHRRSFKVAVIEAETMTAETSRDLLARLANAADVQAIVLSPHLDVAPPGWSIVRVGLAAEPAMPAAADAAEVAVDEAVDAARVAGARKLLAPLGADALRAIHAEQCGGVGRPGGDQALAEILEFVEFLGPDLGVVAEWARAAELAHPKRKRPEPEALVDDPEVEPLTAAEVEARLDHLDARCVLLPERDRLVVASVPKKAVP